MACVWPGAASARPRYRDKIEQARILFQEGRAALHAGDFVVAIARFKESYALSARPLLLFNVAVAASSAMQPELAHEYFEKYLVAAEPKAPERAEAEGALRNLDKVIAQRSLLKAQTPTRPAPAPTAAPSTAAPTEVAALSTHPSNSSDVRGKPPEPPRAKTVDEAAPAAPMTSPFAATPPAVTAGPTSGDDGVPAAALSATPPPRRSHRGLVIGLTLGAVALAGGAIAIGLVFGLSPSYPATAGQAHLH